MSIRIDIISGHMANWNGSFDKDVVTIGRALDADVQLHPTRDTVCSRGIHAQLERSDGRWYLVPVHPTGVGVSSIQGGDVRACGPDERIPIDREMELTIGTGGPRLAVIPSYAPVPSTHKQRHGVAVAPPVGRIPADILYKARQSHAGVRRLSKFGGGVALVLVAAVVILAWRGIAAGRVTTAQIAQLSARVKESSKASLMTAHNAAIAARESVYLVGVKDIAGGFTPIGTAWAVAPGRLATNAHVAEGLRNAVTAATTRGVSSATMVARRGPAQRDEIIVGSMVIHPGYQKWREAMDLQLTRSVGGVQRVSLIAPCDVAILEITQGDAGTPLPLAGSTGTPHLPRIGDAVAYVGFPMENVAGLPAMQTPTGHLTAVTDFFFRTASPDQSLLLHYDAVTTGGSSGSPLLDGEGAVIGLVSAGSAGTSAHGGRIPIGFNYAQRVDLLRELLDGTATEAQAAREKAWEDRIRSVFLGPKDVVADVMSAALKQRRGASSGEPVSDIEITVESGGRGASRSTLTIEPGFEYAFCAAVNDWSAIVLGVFEGKACLASLDPMPVPMLWLDAPGTRRDVEIVVFASSTRTKQPNGVVRVIRVKK